MKTSLLKNVNFVVAILSEKDDKQIQRFFAEEKLENQNSYQRSVGLILIAENVKVGQ
jgi:hypothetical protein